MRRPRIADCPAPHSRTDRAVPAQRAGGLDVGLRPLSRLGRPWRAQRQRHAHASRGPRLSRPRPRAGGERPCPQTSVCGRPCGIAGCIAGCLPSDRDARRRRERRPHHSGSRSTGPGEAFAAARASAGAVGPCGCSPPPAPCATRVTQLRGMHGARVRCPLHSFARAPRVRAVLHAPHVPARACPLARACHTRACMVHAATATVLNGALLLPTLVVAPTTHIA